MSNNNYSTDVHVHYIISKKKSTVPTIGITKIATAKTMRIVEAAVRVAATANINLRLLAFIAGSRSEWNAWRKRALHLSRRQSRRRQFGPKSAAAAIVVCWSTVAEHLGLAARRGARGRRRQRRQRRWRRRWRWRERQETLQRGEEQYLSSRRPEEVAQRQWENRLEGEVPQVMMREANQRGNKRRRGQNQDQLKRRDHTRLFFRDTPLPPIN